MITLNPIFSSNMVLQANKPVRIFGGGSGNITVELDGEKKSAVSENDSWLVELSAHDYGGPPYRKNNSGLRS